MKSDNNRDPEKLKAIDPDEIVGHKTFRDGTGFRHEPLTRAEGDAIIAACDAAQAKRAETYPTAEDAVSGLWDAWQRLRELGWNDARYAPPDGLTKRVIECGSSGIHDAHCDPHPLREGEKWWWSESEGDTWPMKPILYLPTDEERVALRARIEAARKEIGDDRP